MFVWCAAMADFDYESMIVIAEGRELRTSKSGKTRCTIHVTSEELIHNFSPKQLAAGPAAAIANFYRQALRNIQEVASPATLRNRKVAAKAFALGKAWAVQRYSGGKMGPMAPNQTDREFNDSGRMAASIAVNASSDGSYRVNVAANRLNGATGNFERIWAKLVSLIPEFEDFEKLLNNSFVNAAVQKAVGGTITKTAKRANDAGLEAVIKGIEFAVQTFETIEEMTG